jgi:hypothetical protein
VTQTKAAEYAECTRQYITKLVTEGRVKRYDDGKVDLYEVLNYMQKTDNLQEKDISESSKSQEEMPLSEAKRRREIILLRIDEMEYKERKGEIVRIETVKKHWATIATILRNNLLAIPTKAAPYCVGKSANEIKEILSDELNKVLEDMQKDAAKS